MFTTIAGPLGGGGVVLPQRHIGLVVGGQCGAALAQLADLLGEWIGTVAGLGLERGQMPGFGFQIRQLREHRVQHQPGLGFLLRQALLGLG